MERSKSTDIPLLLWYELKWPAAHQRQQAIWLFILTSHLQPTPSSGVGCMGYFPVPLLACLEALL